MEDNKNKLTLDFGSSPSLASALAGKQPGDKVTIKVEFSIDEITDSDVRGSIEEVEVHESESDDEVEVEASSPVMLVMSKKDKSEDSY